MTHVLTTPAAGADAPGVTAPSLAHLPVTLFASVMGVGGLSLAWRRAARTWAVPQWPAQVLLALAAATFLVVGAAYALKWVRFPAAARAELRHPVRMTFAPTLTVSLLVLATAGRDVAPGVASVLWWLGAVGHLAATFAVLGAWSARTDIGPAAVTPAWFVPVVGNVVAPLAAAEVGSVEVAWFAFGVGVVFWLALLPLVLHRLLLHDSPLPERLLPTVAILAAPPAVSLLAWQALTGTADGPVVRILGAATLAFVLLLAAHLPRLRRLPFGLPWWAYTFPLAAAAAAAVSVAGTRPQVGYDVVAAGLLVVATVVVVGVAGLTVRTATRREICRPE
ncbi:SLAC1 anion channel family protein [Phycicoccus sonneratiae]|uniref:SLAC1 anion channel family protein n=1 Tax=Phycicoccus sonneratiae TaxID=2807628 RepID=A0ABS2CHH0_9MICO|nr:SLAC1 anion channel family protein [Phycicoccus sonneraticus]MBM6399332.1 SLAC1 anion channel family protein [Phycicoccus sonneraticus]